MNTVNELYHFGILGQKWGVRRFQNPDGTLTAAGKARLGSKLNGRVDKIKAKRSSERKTISEHEERLADIKKKGTNSKYVEAELARRRQAQAERQKRDTESYYRDLHETDKVNSYSHQYRARERSYHQQEDWEEGIKSWRGEGKYGKKQIARELTESSEARIAAGKQYLKRSSAQLKYLNSLNIDEISESGVGYREAKRMLKQKRFT